jgi:inosine triphosphate pyrophosphatase
VTNSRVFFHTSYAEMDKVEKNKISHRFKALEKLQAWFVKEMTS